MISSNKLVLNFAPAISSGTTIQLYVSDLFNLPAD